jgi:hypothetical protein
LSAAAASPGKRLRRIAAAMALAGATAACGPSIDLGPVGEPGRAREALVKASAAGPVAAEVYGNPFGLDEARRDALATSSIAEGIEGLQARFATDPAVAAAAQPRLVVLLNPIGDPPGDIVCSAPQQVRTGAATGELLAIAAFCDRGDVINMVRGRDEVAGPTDHNLKRLFWRMADALFPDDYGDRFGVNLIPGLNIGIGGSFGF